MNYTISYQKYKYLVFKGMRNLEQNKTKQNKTKQKVLGN